jgi:hypothetical protein
LSNLLASWRLARDIAYVAEIQAVVKDAAM